VQSQRLRSAFKSRFCEVGNFFMRSPARYFLVLLGEVNLEKTSCKNPCL
jgi:hypothetical protein